MRRTTSVAAALLCVAASAPLVADDAQGFLRVVEGEATLIHTLWVMRRVTNSIPPRAMMAPVMRMQADLDIDQLRGMVGESAQKAMAEIDNIPPFVLEILLGNYLKGAAFVFAVQEQGWEAVEIVFHEYSHILVERLAQKLNAALGDGVTQHPVLWHTVQFYLTGETVRAALARRNIEYTPSSDGMFQRSWPQYRQPVTDAWAPYLEGRVSMDESIAKTVAALGTSK